MKKREKIHLKFLGGARTVTGSKTLLEVGNTKILVDCGLFQGLKELRKLNWREITRNASEIDYVLLTHAHLDHCGYLPILVKNGFKGTIYCTHPTKELATIVLRDSGKIQEEDANRANRYEYSSHSPAKPLYTQADAEAVVNQFSTHNYEEWVILEPEIKFQLLNAGHILGSAMVELKIYDQTLVFTGDIGRTDPMLLYPPKKVSKADYLIIESTYGDREHDTLDVKMKLERVIKETFQRGGILMVPTFSIERVQEIMFLMYQLRNGNRLPNVPIYLDSPMGIRATEVFETYPKWQDLSRQDLQQMYEGIRWVNSYEASKAIVKDKNPKIILAGSGMLQGGRILHYLSEHIGNEKNTLLFTGYQAEGTRGRALLKGSSSIKFFGEYHSVKCQIASISSLSAHGDRTELLQWMEHFQSPPKKVFLNHGEPHQLDAFRVWIESKLGWDVIVPYQEESFEL
ncbi:MAG: MBL fold metallo-hydrolase [bacterium]|nr:MBL fold metallo-hydrolase [bacterium]